MIIPIRCFSCGKPVGHLIEEFRERLDKGEPMKKVLDAIGLKRYCCRGIYLGHVELIDIAGEFKRG